MTAAETKKDAASTSSTSPPASSSFKISMPLRFVGWALAITCLSGFLIGKTVRSLLIDAQYKDALLVHDDIIQQVLAAQQQQQRQRTLDQHAGTTSSNGEHSSNIHLELPDPVMRDGRIIPQTLYSSKNFDTARSASVSSRWIKPAKNSGAQQPQPAGDDGDDDDESAPSSACVDENSTGDSSSTSTLSTAKSCPRSSVTDPATLVSPTANADADADEAHLPAGQHLLMDIENVDSAFLNSEERLAVAMLDLVNQCGLTLLSYHCHKLTPTGVTCAGVLLESHVSFHTWPERGVITLDLFTCGPNSLLPVVPVAEALFSIPRQPSHAGEEVEPPHVVWAHKLRGFRDDDDDEDGHDDGLNAQQLSDVMNYPIGQRLDYKNEIVSVQTIFQRIDIYDAFPRAKESLVDYDKSIGLIDPQNNPYHMQNPQFFQPDRIVFLDGVMQSRRHGDAAYHEGLVHPSLFAHDNPKRVAIIGGGEGATLREVLKHSTVEKVVWIEIDQTMVEVSTQYLPEWSDCSDIAGSTDSCLDDPRVEIYYEDAFKWFDDRFPIDGPLIEAFDVVIMDALDPQVQIDFVDALYSEGTFLKSISRSLNHAGMLVAQVGKAPMMRGPAEDYSIDKNRMKFIESLIDLDFEHVRNYEESHCGFDAAWEIIVAMKSYDSKAKWFANSAVVDYKIRTRSLPSKGNGVSLRYFDGATMQSYHFPSRQSEVVYCRRRPMPLGCIDNRGFDQTRANLPISLLQVQASSLGENAGRGVFAAQDIPAHSYVGLERLVHTVYIEPRSYSIINEWYERNHPIYNAEYYPYVLEMYADAYGHSFSDRGEIHIYSDASIHTFINHGCQGSNNVGYNFTIDESAELSFDDIPAEIMKTKSKAYVYNPSIDRQPHFYSSGFPLRDIAAGEELFDNYLGMTGLTSKNWKAEFETLQKQCRGDGVGYVKYYEESASSEGED
eukprot:CAMPEP_0119568268 /NCGR_PEP_ID=MMETSP1352-20130426/38409_1 /TAXON_ID=265584 /ORGANISM="Stauroneis constricta, Strain CCMP1120" /LENGTH=947 /DNA_ID=CAMNT_0007617637 /DNA_START=95 /DNA_END=2938 /DNA_ORIENTATION=+